MGVISTSFFILTYIRLNLSPSNLGLQLGHPHKYHKFPQKNRVGIQIPKRVFGCAGGCNGWYITIIST